MHTRRFMPFSTGILASGFTVGLVLSAFVSFADEPLRIHVFRLC
jgi:hypothetical protein